MKQLITTIIALLFLPLTVLAQHEEDTENGVVSLSGKEGFTIGTKKGDFVFKPYMLVQTSANISYYDDEGLDLAYNQDNIANSGFSIPYAILGFTGKAFNMVTFNLSINAASSGGGILQQAWFDVKLKESFAIRVGKFKTPFAHAYLTTLGETLMPTLPVSLTAPVILPYSLNAVTPNIGTGFDLGVEVHGLIKEKFGYEVGIFNGTGSSVNVASKTFSDDWHIPSLLYAGRITYNYLGGYVQGGYFVTNRLQATARYDFFNRNGVDTNGFLNMPAVGFNYFFTGCNLKLQAMYQFIGRTGHDTQLDRDNDDLGLAMHSGTVLLQYTF